MATYVVAVEGAVIECDWLLPSLQLPNTYRLPVPPDWGLEVLTVWDDPLVQFVLYGVMRVVPSTITESPAGMVLNVILAGVNGVAGED